MDVVGLIGRKERNGGDDVFGRADPPGQWQSPEPDFLTGPFSAAAWDAATARSIAAANIVLGFICLTLRLGR